MSIDHLVGIPFKWGGVDRSGCDCLGLANLARAANSREPVRGFGWVYQKYASTAQLPERTVEDELIGLGWKAVSTPQNLDVLILRGRFSLAIGTVWGDDVLWFPAKLSAMQLIDYCGEILGCYREQSK